MTFKNFLVSLFYAGLVGAFFYTVALVGHMAFDGVVLGPDGVGNTYNVADMGLLVLGFVVILAFCLTWLIQAENDNQKRIEARRQERDKERELVNALSEQRSRTRALEVRLEELEAEHEPDPCEEKEAS